MNFNILYPAAIGLFIGGIFSLVFGIYSKPTATKYTYDFFGINSNTVIQYSAILLGGLLIALYTGFSVLIRDIKYPTENPLRFTLETVLAASIPATVIFIMTYLREERFTPKTAVEFGAITLKCGVLHILLQFSGVYGSVFGV